MRSRHWLYTILSVVVIVIAAVVLIQFSGDPVPDDPKQEATTTAPEPAGANPPTPDAPAAAPDIPVPPTPAEPHTPGETPSWRTGPTGETEPAGTNRTTIEGGQQPAEDRPPVGVAR